MLISKTFWHQKLLTACVESFQVMLWFSLKHDKQFELHKQCSYCTFSQLASPPFPLWVTVRLMSGRADRHTAAQWRVRQGRAWQWWRLDVSGSRWETRHTEDGRPEWRLRNGGKTGTWVRGRCDGGPGVSDQDRCVSEISWRSFPLFF